MKAMLEAQEVKEAEAARKREEEKIQTDLFGPMEVPVPKHYDTLRARYGILARNLVTSLLTAKIDLSYDLARIIHQTCAQKRSGHSQVLVF